MTLIHDAGVDTSFESAVVKSLGKPLRNWQREALDAWQSNKQIGVIEAVTGSGKSLVGILAAVWLVALVVNMGMFGIGAQLNLKPARLL